MSTYELEATKTTQVTSTSYAAFHGLISPNGQLVAYTLNDSKAFHVCLKPTEPGGKTVQISAQEGSEEPRWTTDGKRVIYRSGQHWYEVALLNDETLEVSQPMLAMEGDYHNILGFSFDIIHEANAFLFVKTTGEKIATEIKLIKGWLNELE